MLDFLIGKGCLEVEEISSHLPGDRMKEEGETS